MNDNTDKEVCEVEQSVMNRAMKTQSNAITSLEEAVASLEEKLQSVILYESASDKEEDKLKIGSSPLVNEIEKSIDRINNVAVIVKRLYDFCEL